MVNRKPKSLYERTRGDHMRTPIWFKLWGAFILTVIVVGGYFAITYNQDLMKECIADGHKQYECAAMLDSQHNIRVIVDSGKDF